MLISYGTIYFTDSLIRCGAGRKFDEIGSDNIRTRIYNRGVTYRSGLHTVAGNLYRPGRPDAHLCPAKSMVETPTMAAP